MRFFCSKLSLFMIVLFCLILTGCSKEVQPQSKTYYTFFDTVSSVYSYASDSESEFEKNCQSVYEILEKCHKLFDIYHEYDGLNNLCTINANAGKEYIETDPLLIEFLRYAEYVYELTEHKTNVTMGSVLSLWHDARMSDISYVPDEASLKEAVKHIGFDKLEIDEKNNSVRLTDEKSSIDAGALGKGFAVQKALEYLKGKGVTSYVLNVGGSVCAIGNKENKKPWIVGIRNPGNDGNSVALRVEVSDASCVTSGSYERFFVFDNKSYSHIIDPDTLFPPEYFLSVSVISSDSALADALSTALCCMTYEEGLALIEKLENTGCIWIFPDGSFKCTENVKIC